MQNDGDVIGKIPEYVWEMRDSYRKLVGDIANAAVGSWMDVKLEDFGGTNAITPAVFDRYKQDLLSCITAKVQRDVTFRDYVADVQGGKAAAAEASSYLVGDLGASCEETIKNSPFVKITEQLFMSKQIKNIFSAFG
jgi:hypothetical protein